MRIGEAKAEAEADCGLRIADCGLEIGDCGLGIGDCGLERRIGEAEVPWDGGAE